MELWLVIALFLVIWLLRARSSTKGLDGIPRLERSWTDRITNVNPVWKLMQDGYDKVMKVSQQPFVLNYWNRDYIVLPMKYLADMKRANKDRLRFFQSVSDVFFMGLWTDDLLLTDRMTFAIKKGLNPKLPEITDLCIAEAHYAFEKELGDCTPPKQLTAMLSFPLISHRIGSRLMVGSELCRNDTFIRESAAYNQSMFLFGFALLKLPLGPLRERLIKPLSYFQRRRQAKVIKMVAPEVAKRLDERNKGTTPKLPRHDFIEWTLNILDEHPPSPNHTPEPQRISHEAMLVGLALNQNPSGTVVQMLFQILEEPQYLQSLRQEAENALQEYGWTDKLTSALPLQDSFIREIHRLYPTLTLSSQRTVVGNPYTFSDGMVLPESTRICFPASPLQTDPTHFPNPLSFHGYRFLKLAEESKNNSNDSNTLHKGVNTWAAHHPSPTNMTFGYGNHVCPGRFLAIRLIKIIFTKVVTEYDFWWDREAGKGQPSRFEFEGTKIPCPRQRIWLRKRGVEGEER